MEAGLNEGMNPLEQHLIQLVEGDVVSKEEGIAHANDGSIVRRLE
jgi:Tfp pilus assembly ATPase PilU